MDLSKLRIMQQIQIALIEKGLSADVIESCGYFVLQAWLRVDDVVIAKLEQLDTSRVTEVELQLWHDNIVYGPQVTVKEGE